MSLHRSHRKRIRWSRSASSCELGDSSVQLQIWVPLTSTCRMQGLGAPLARHRVSATGGTWCVCRSRDEPRWSLSGELTRQMSLSTMQLQLQQKPLPLPLPSFVLLRHREEGEGRRGGCPRSTFSVPLGEPLEDAGARPRWLVDEGPIQRLPCCCVLDRPGHCSWHQQAGQACGSWGLE